MLMNFPIFVDSMTDVFKWKSRGKGAFAFDNGVKVLQGSRCALIRNNLNVHGKSSDLLRSNCTYTTADLTQTSFLADKNCVQLRAPHFGNNEEGASLSPSSMPSQSLCFVRGPRSKRALVMSSDPTSLHFCRCQIVDK